MELLMSGCEIQTEKSVKKKPTDILILDGNHYTMVSKRAAAADNFNMNFN